MTSQTKLQTITQTTPMPAWFTEAETLKAQVLDRLEAMSPAQQRRPPAPNAWSAAQVVAHLIMVEEFLVDDWRAAAGASPSVRPSWRGTLAVGMVNFIMNTSLRMPTLPGLDPEGNGEFLALSDRWHTVRGRLRGMVPSDPSDTARLWIIHPAFGPLSCPQMGSFLVAHIRHHLKHWPIVAAVNTAG